MEEFCKDHINLMSGVVRIEEKVVAIDKRINGSIDDIHDHIKAGIAYRIGIISVAAMLVIQTITLAFMWGQLCRTVEVNSGRIAAIENLHPRYDGK
jgi:hypothetical protein